MHINNHTGASGFPENHEERYRYSLLIRIPSLVAASFWGAILVILLMGGEHRVSIYLGAGFFVLFFLFFGSIYWLTEVRLGPDGLRYKGPLRTLEAGWSEVLKINVYEGLIYSWMLTEYQVVTSNGSFSFTPFMSRHRRLVKIIRSMAAKARWEEDT